MLLKIKDFGVVHLGLIEIMVHFSEFFEFSQYLDVQYDLT